MWPPCGHVFHLTCVANLRAHNPTPTCPACRSPRHPSTETHFQQLCAQHEILIPEPASHTRPTVTHARPPPSPAGVLPLCCNRVLLLDPTRADRDEAWRELPERHMHWAPSRDNTSQQWRPEWTCLRCNTTVTLEHHLLQQVPEPPHCPHHGPRTLVLDMQRGERGWACTRGTDIQPCTPTALPAQPPATTRADDQHTEENQSLPPWMSHGPPRHQPGPTNSWLYVPLLHAGAARLHPRQQPTSHHPQQLPSGWDASWHCRSQTVGSGG